MCLTFTAHTISQRLRTLKKIPPELVPLGVVISYVYVPRALKILS